MVQLTTGWCLATNYLMTLGKSLKGLVMGLSMLLLGVLVSEKGWGQTTVTLTTGTSWTVPANVYSIKVECWGGGGAGGSGNSLSSGGSRAGTGGGAGGAYARVNTLFVTPGNNITYSIGAAGINASSVTTVGNTYPGGDTWFSSNTTVLAKGGAGAPNVGTVTTLTNGAGATGTVTGSIGDQIYAGGSGGSGQGNASGNNASGGGGSSAGTGSYGNAGGNASGSTAGTGGAAPTGGFAGANGVSNTGASGTTVAATNYGAAGSGAVITTSVTARIGGAGAQGKIVITYYTSRYGVLYYGNGNDAGSVPLDGNNPYTSGASVTVLGNTGSLAKTGYIFNGWNTAADGSGSSYAAGSTFNINTNVSLYAQWSAPCTSQTISGLTGTDTKTYGDASYSLSATASSGLSVSYSSSNTSVATISGSTVAIVGAGTTTITASQAGNGTYCAATNVTQTLTVNKKDLTISGLTANDKTFDGTVAATLTGTPALVGVIPADVGNVTLGGTATATFADAAVGTNKTVTVTGYTISGSASGNYNLIQPTGLTANITAAANSIDLAPSTQAKGPFCNASSNSLSLTYTTTGTVTPPLKIQLSNTSGTFVSGTTDLTGAVVTGSGPYTITASIPAVTTAGTLYRLRILSSDATPVSSLNNGSDITITAAVTPSVSIAVSPSNAICSGISVTFTPTPTNGGTPTYVWWKNGIGTGTNIGSGTTLTTSALVNGDVVAAVMTSTISCVSSTTANSNDIMMAVTPSVAPAVSIAITTGTNPTCTGNFTFTATPTNGGTTPSYQWKNGAANVGSNAATYSPTGLVDGSSISVIMTSNAACASPTSATSNTVNITNNLPAQPSAITGSTSVYQTQTGVSYSVTNVAGVTYTWSYSGTGATITSGQGTNSVAIDFASNATAGTLTVTPSKSGCTGTASSLSIAVGPPNDLCSNAITLALNTSTAGTLSNATATTGATSYAPTKNDVWYKFTPTCTGTHTIAASFAVGPDLDFDVFTSACPSSNATGTVISHSFNTTDETSSATFTAGTTYYIRVVDYNTNASSFTIQVTGYTAAPATPGSITGSASVCANTTGLGYSVSAVTNATSYNWTVLSDWSITAGSTTNAIIASSGVASGNVTVTASNYCGTSTAQTLAISTTNLAAPVATAGSNISSNSFDASWNSSVGATGYYVDVYTLTSNSTVAGWTFPVSGTTITPDTYSSNNSAQVLTATGTSAISSLAGNSTEAASATGWNSGNGIKNWQVLVNTTGFYSMVVSSKQRSSDSGPRDFKLQYKIGTSGTWTDVSGGSVTVANNFTTGILNSISLPSVCDNQSDVYIRWIMTSNIAVDGGSIISGSTSRIDDILISGASVTYVSGFQNTSSSASPLEVTGLAATTTYYYVVRSTNGTCTSGNSNIISVTTAAPCTPTASISSFLPTSGPAYTMVTIKGTGFTGATTVKFGTINAISFTVVNSTTITAEVPTNAPTDKIAVTVGSCDAVSAGNFTSLSQSGCGSGGSYGTELFISEVFDSDKGSISYIEIFNPTNATINLSTPNQYVVRFITGTSTITDYTLTGTIASGAVWVLRVGDPTISGSTLCTGFTPGQTFDAGSGFNGNDRIYLRKNGADIDYIPNPNYGGSTFTGFSQVRNSSVTGPSTSYNASQWTTYNVESCANLGVAPYTVSSPSVTISAHPADVSCSAITFSVSATASPSPVSSYLWYYNDPSTQSGWTDASTLSNGTTVTSGTNTSTMTITGLTAHLKDYQFYVVVTKTSGSTCTQYSNAAQYTYTTLPVYRSKTGVTNGSWTTASNWEMSNSTSGPWQSTCEYPVALNSSHVIIQSGTSIILSNDLDIDKVTIESTGQLELSTTAKLILYDSSAAEDLTINGTLYDRGTTGNGISYGIGATYLLGTSGTIIKSNTSSGSNYRDKYYNGIVNMPTGASGAKFVFRYNGDGNTSVVAAGMYYPNLYFENTAITSRFDFKSSTMALSGATGGNCTVYGSMYLGTTGTGQVGVYNNNINTSSMLINGNLQIGANSVLTNVSHDGNTDAAHGNGTGIELKGNLQNAGTFDNTYGAGILNLTGSSAQTISGGGTTTSYDLTVNNTSGNTSAAIDMQTDVSVTHLFTLTNGVVKTNASPNGLLSLGTVALAVAGSPGTSSYINGPMAKQFLVGANTEFLYPIGKPGGYPNAYNPCYVVPTNITGATTTFTSEYFVGPQEAQGVMGTSVLGITSKEYWDVAKSPSNSSAARVKLYYNNPNNPGLGNWIYYTTASSSPYYTTAIDPCWYCNVAVVHKEGTTWNFTRTSNFSSTDPEYRFYGNDGWIYSAAVTSFSPFSLGYSYNVILPVKLLSFTGRLQNADGKLEWKIADARDLESFDLEYSRDGRTFQKLANLPSNGSLAYDFLHKNLPYGANYYRLLVKEKTGNSFYSQVVTLNMGKLVTYVIGVTTGAGGQLNTVVYSASNQKLQATITDVLGRQLLQASKPLAQGTNQWSIETSMLPKGMYFVTLRAEDGLQQTTRFVKE